MALTLCSSGRALFGIWGRLETGDVERLVHAADVLSRATAGDIVFVCRIAAGGGRLDMEVAHTLVRELLSLPREHDHIAAVHIAMEGMSSNVDAATQSVLANTDLDPAPYRPLAVHPTVEHAAARLADPYRRDLCALVSYASHIGLLCAPHDDRRVKDFAPYALAAAS